MIDGISLVDLGPIGGALVLVFFPYIQMARGKLVPRQFLEDVKEDRDKWQAAHGISETARATSAAQVEELLEHAKLTDSLIRSLPSRPED